MEEAESLSTAAHGSTWEDRVTEEAREGLPALPEAAVVLARSLFNGTLCQRPLRPSELSETAKRLLEAADAFPEKTTPPAP
jgi:hypothetical protein